MSSRSSGPANVIESFAERIGGGDLEGALALYEDEAVFRPEPGRLVRGREEIRAALEGFLALRPTITGEVESVLTAGDVALVTNDWTLRGTDPGRGGEVRMAARSADVLRRRADGSWGILIDDPWGGG